MSDYYRKRRLTNMAVFISFAVGRASANLEPLREREKERWWQNGEEREEPLPPSFLIAFRGRFDKRLSSSSSSAFSAGAAAGLWGRIPPHHHRPPLLSSPLRFFFQEAENLSPSLCAISEKPTSLFGAEGGRVMAPPTGDGRLGRDGLD